MPQNEMMLRLLWNGDIVGYEWLVGGEIYRTHSKTLPDKHTFDGKDGLVGWKTFPSVDDDMWITYDGFEQGIKVETGWWFEGDIIRIYNDAYRNGEWFFEDNYSDNILTYSSKDFKWIPIEKDTGQKCCAVQNNWWTASKKERVGSIHDKESANDKT